MAISKTMIEHLISDLKNLGANFELKPEIRVMESIQEFDKSSLSKVQLMKAHGVLYDPEANLVWIDLDTILAGKIANSAKNFRTLVLQRVSYAKIDNYQEIMNTLKNKGYIEPLELEDDELELFNAINDIESQAWSAAKALCEEFGYSYAKEVESALKGPYSRRHFLLTAKKKSVEAKQSLSEFAEKLSRKK